MKNTTETQITQPEKKQWNEPTMTQLSINFETLIGNGVAADGLMNNT